MNRLSIVVGAQYGSEGKGAVVGHLARQLKDTDLVIRVGGPNAGHTVVDESGQTWKLRQIPAAAPVSNCRLHLAAGSEIDHEVLLGEIDALREGGHPVEHRLTIDPAATILDLRHRNLEATVQLTDRIGSTGKGIGAARAERIMREALTVHQWAQIKLGGTNSMIAPSPHSQVWGPTGDNHVIVEGTQGFGLGLHGPHYPYATSSDCTAIDFLSMAQVSPWCRQVDQLEVWLVARVYPIRVAGNSGPLHGETTWDKLGLPPEYTTVTNKIRRVGRWNASLVRDAVAANGGHPVVRIALMMADQMWPQIAGMTDEDGLAGATGFAYNQFVESLEQDCGAQVGLVGTGPDTCVWIRTD